jgi:hypothetical protein
MGSAVRNLSPSSELKAVRRISEASCAFFRRPVSVTRDYKKKPARTGEEVPTVVVPSSHRARRVKVKVNCCANLDAPARDASLNRQRCPLRVPGETECRHVQAQAAVPAVQRPAG